MRAAAATPSAGAPDRAPRRLGRRRARGPRVLRRGAAAHGPHAGPSDRARRLGLGARRVGPRPRRAARSAGARSRRASSARAARVAATQSGVGNLEHVVVWSALFAAMLRYATPLIFAALGGLVSERSGVINIALEGMMLMGAFFGVWGADIDRLVGRSACSSRWSPAARSALVHAMFAVTLRADQIVARHRDQLPRARHHGLPVRRPLRRPGHARRPARACPTSRCRSRTSRSSATCSAD